jgi:hypothetical protein
MIACPAIGGVLEHGHTFTVTIQVIYAAISADDAVRAASYRDAGKRQ